jgi:hypothetical protein
MQKVMVMLVVLIFGVSSLAIAGGCCGGPGGYGFRGGPSGAYGGGYGPGSCCGFGPNAQVPSCCLPGTQGIPGGQVNPGAAPGTPVPPTK